MFGMSAILHGKRAAIVADITSHVAFLKRDTESACTSQTRAVSSTAGALLLSREFFHQRIECRLGGRVNITPLIGLFVGTDIARQDARTTHSLGNQLADIRLGRLFGLEHPQRNGPAQ